MPRTAIKGWRLWGSTKLPHNKEGNPQRIPQKKLKSCNTFHTPSRTRHPLIPLPTQYICTWSSSYHQHLSQEVTLLKATVHNTTEQDIISMPSITLNILHFQDHTLIHNLWQQPPLQDQKHNMHPSKQQKPQSSRRKQKEAAFQDHKKQNIPPFQDHRHHLHAFHNQIHQWSTSTKPSYYISPQWDKNLNTHFNFSQSTLNSSTHSTFWTDNSSLFTDSDSDSNNDSDNQPSPQHVTDNYAPTSP